MNKFIGAAVLAATLGVAAGPALGQDVVRETRSVDARILKVNLGGAINLRLRQGPTASLVVSGAKGQVAKVMTSQSGDTLRIDTDNDGQFNFGKKKEHLRVELTLPNLQELVSHGVGSTDVSGFSGEQIRLVLDGAGALTLTGRYRMVDARLGGVGSMTLDAGDSERVDLNLRGAGQIAVSGHTKVLRAKLGGVGSLDAQGLRADTVDLDMTGLGGASVYAKTNANLRLNGLGSATVYGKPANRNSTARGLGGVNWE